MTDSIPRHRANIGAFVGLVLILLIFFWEEITDVALLRGRSLEEPSTNLNLTLEEYNAQQQQHSKLVDSFESLEFEPESQLQTVADNNELQNSSEQSSVTLDKNIKNMSEDELNDIDASLSTNHSDSLMGNTLTLPQETPRQTKPDSIEKPVEETRDNSSNILNMNKVDQLSDNETQLVLIASENMTSSDNAVQITVEEPEVVQEPEEVDQFSQDENQVTLTASDNVTSSPDTAIKIVVEKPEVVPEPGKQLSNPQQSSSCDAACPLHGTCNEEEGKCICPLGRAGPACEQLAAPACEITTNYILPCSKLDLPAPCQCKMQCQQIHMDTADAFFNNPCLDTTQAAEGAEAVMTRPQELPVMFADMTRLRPAREGEMRTFQPRPLADCPASCSMRGFCKGPGTPRCVCFYGYGGTRCERAAATYCPSGCQGRGKCEAGFCRCDPGSYGMDCSLVKDPNGNGSKLFWEITAAAPPVAVSPRVFVYELPPAFTTWSVTLALGLQGDFGRPIGYGFLDRMLSSRHRVSDPTTADYFFVPAVGNRQISRTRAMQHVLHNWRFWNESSTPNHLWIGADDAGACAYFHPSAPPPEAFHRKSVFLSHLGLHVGASRGYTGCYIPGQDIVIPPEGIAPFAKPPVSYYNIRPSRMPPPKRTIKLLFIGSIIPKEQKIPHNVRQQVQEHHGHREGYIISEQKVADYPFKLASSQFCLAASGKGGGWGMRFGSAVVAGCVPVIIMDNTTEVLEELLPYEKFAVRVLENDIPRLHEILDNITEDRLEELQKELECIHKFFLWSSIFGIYGREDGSLDAFAGVMEILRRRIQGEVGQWSSSCGQTLSSLYGSSHPPRITCGVGNGNSACTKGPREMAREKAVNALHGPWAFGGAACTAQKDSGPPC